MADLVSRVEVLEDWRDRTVDPVLKNHEERIMELRAYADETSGKFTVIVWLNGVILALVIGLIIALFTWGLEHITLRVESVPQKIGLADPLQLSTNPEMR